MHPGFELFDHTADVGIRIWAPTMAGLVGPATDGLYAVIGELKSRGPTSLRVLEFEAGDAAGLLRDYLTEVLHLFETERRLVSVERVDVFKAGQLRVVGAVAALDTDGSVYYREVKAITYHELAIGEVAGGVEARVIVDI